MGPNDPCRKANSTESARRLSPARLSEILLSCPTELWQCCIRRFKPRSLFRCQSKLRYSTFYLFFLTSRGQFWAGSLSQSSKGGFSAFAALGADDAGNDEAEEECEQEEFFDPADTFTFDPGGHVNVNMGDENGLHAAATVCTISLDAWTGSKSPNTLRLQGKIHGMYLSW